SVSNNDDVSSQCRGRRTLPWITARSFAASWCPDAVVENVTQTRSRSLSPFPQVATPLIHKIAHRRLRQGLAYLRSAVRDQDVHQHRLPGLIRSIRAPRPVRTARDSAAQD